MSDTKKDQDRKPVDYGQLKPAVPPTKKHPRLPAQFRGQVIDCMTSETGAMSYEHSCRKYGLWKVRALKPAPWFGKSMQPGDTFELPGNSAVFATLDGDVEFVDPRLDQEDKALAEIARLKLNVPARDNPAFAQREPHDSTVAHSNRR